MSDAQPGQKVFLIGSRTGGPLIPLLALRDQLLEIRSDLEFVIVGIRGGFEEQIARSDGMPLLYLPEIKRSAPQPKIGPASVRRLLARILSAASLLVLPPGLAYSCLKALFYLLRERPRIILSMSNFLSVPIIWAATCINLMRRVACIVTLRSAHYPQKRIRIALHQLDLINLTARLTAPLVDLYSIGFAAPSRRKRNPVRLPNPVRYNQFDGLTSGAARKQLVSADLLAADNRAPILLIFGGGSGAAVLNRWVADHLGYLVRHFFVIHLTGFLQQGAWRLPDGGRYRSRSGLTDLMPAVLVASDLVLSRAGMSSVSELLYLQKKAYLVPIPDTHQEANARSVAAYFRLLDQRQQEHWWKIIDGDRKNRYSHFKKINWDYYTAANRFAFRDALLEMIK